MKLKETFHPLFRTLREVLVPDWGEIAVSFLATLVIYGIISYDFFLHKLSGNNPELRSYSYDLFSDSLSKVSQLPFAGNVLSALVWGSMGIVVYILLILVLNFFITTKNNAMTNSPMLSKPELLAFSILDEYRRMFWIFAFIGILVVSLLYLLPFWLECFREFNYSYSVEFIVTGSWSIS